jgi:hypothetical protein
MTKFVIVIALLGLAFAFIKTALLTRQINKRLGVTLGEPMLFSGCVVIVFLAFTALGLTGSSLNLGLRQTPFVEADMDRVWGHEQSIRSDEWLVITPMAIAQYTHEPRFPVVNRNRGPDGHNMLVTGMAGLPVAHLSALAKPATWGFFVFDLKRALAWYWWFPVMGCFVALAHLLHALAPGHWRQSFLFALLFVATPYAVAWSFWPAYTVFFPCVALLCVLRILQRRRTWALLPLGIVAGLAVAGFVFILYPPWQVTVGYVFIALLVGVALRDRLYRAIGLDTVLALLLAVLVAALLVGSWWLSAREAIGAMMHTVYPGQRSEVGGNMAWQFLFAGYTNLTTLQYAENRPINQSEIASFQYYFLPLAALFLYSARQRALTALELALAVMIGFILLYMLVGIGHRLSTLSLWSFVTAKRADLSLGLACLILTHLLLSQPRASVAVSESGRFMATLIALVWAGLVYSGVRAFDGPQMSGAGMPIILGVTFIAAACSYSLITRQTKLFLGLSLGLTLAMTATFNPLYIAPQHLKNSLTQPGVPVLTLGSQIPAMFLAASGQPVINGIFYYPQLSLWARLDPEGRHAQLYNRYQHLMFFIQPGIEALQILVPHPDVVRVLINPERMDFNITGAQLLLALDGDRDSLSRNPTLMWLRSEKGWSWFAVKAQP